MSDLTINEAITVASNMKNVFKAFARIEEVLQVAAAAKGVADEANKQRTKLYDEIAELEARRAEITTSLSETESVFAARVKELDQSLAAKQAEYTTKLAIAKSQAEEGAQAFEAQAAARAKLVQDELAGLTKQTAAERQVLAGLRQQISDLKTQLIKAVG